MATNCLDELECMSLNMARSISLEDDSLMFEDIMQLANTHSNGGVIVSPSGVRVGNACFFISVADGMGDRSLAYGLMEASGYRDRGRVVDTNNPSHEAVVRKVCEIAAATILIYYGKRYRGKYRINPTPHYAVSPKRPLSEDPPPIIRIVNDFAHFECLVAEVSWDPEVLGEQFIYAPDEQEQAIVYGAQTHALRKASSWGTSSWGTPPHPRNPAMAPTRAPSRNHGVIPRRDPVVAPGRSLARDHAVVPVRAPPRATRLVPPPSLTLAQLATLATAPSRDPPPTPIAATTTRATVRIIRRRSLTATAPPQSIGLTGRARWLRRQPGA